MLYRQRDLPVPPMESASFQAPETADAPQIVPALGLCVLGEK